MGMGHIDQQIVLGEASCLQDGPSDAALIGAEGEPTDINSNNHEISALTAERANSGCTSGKGAVNSLGHIMARSTP